MSLVMIWSIARPQLLIVGAQKYALTVTVHVQWLILFWDAHYGVSFSYFPSIYMKIF